MAYGDDEFLKAVKLRKIKEKARRNAGVYVEVAGWVDQGGNREVFDKIRGKKFLSIEKAEREIMEKFGSGSRSVMKIKSLIDDKEIY